MCLTVSDRSLHYHHLQDEKIVSLSPLPPQIQDRRRFWTNYEGIYGLLHVDELSNMGLSSDIGVQQT